MIKDPISFVWALADIQVLAMQRFVDMAQARLTQDETSPDSLDQAQDDTPVFTLSDVVPPMEIEALLMPASNVLNKAVQAQAQVDTTKPQPKPKTVPAKASPASASGPDPDETSKEEGDGEWFTLARSESTPIRFKGAHRLSEAHTLRNQQSATLDIYERQTGGWMIAVSLTHPKLSRDHTALAVRVQNMDEGADWLESLNISHLLQGLAELEDGRHNAYDMLCEARTLEQVCQDLIGKALHQWAQIEDAAAQSA